jgi:hypothetical protein
MIGIRQPAMTYHFLNRCLLAETGDNVFTFCMALDAGRFCVQELQE